CSPRRINRADRRCPSRATRTRLASSWPARRHGRPIRPAMCVPRPAGSALGLTGAQTGAQTGVQTGTSCHCCPVPPLAGCCTTAEPLAVPAMSATLPLLRLTSVTKLPPADCTVHCCVLVPSCANCTSCVPLAVDEPGTASTLPLCRLVSRLAPAVVVTTQLRLAVSVLEASTTR